MLLTGNDAVVEVGAVGRLVGWTIGKGDGVVGGATRCGDSG